MKKSNKETLVFSLGGLGEVGKNMYVVEHDNEIVIMDAGVLFPEDHLLGIDYVIQDFTYLKENEHKIKALVITHGHEDHIGGIPFLLRDVKIPVIHAPQLAADLIINKLKDRRVNYKNIKIFDEETVIKTRHFQVEFISTTHSIPDSYGVIVRTPNGTIFNTGDFKFDLTPIGPMSNIHKMAKLGDEGLTLLMSDSTNSMNPGSSNSESIVDDALDEIFQSHDSRIIVATFASNIYRIKHIAETCRKHNRKIVVFGRSMENAKNIAVKNKLIKDSSIFITHNESKKYKDSEICILSTGSQGEPLAALSRIADGSHRQITLKNDDIVVFSSSPIPGNTAGINRVINKLYLKGVKVYTNKQFNDIHTSGHAKEDELKWMLRLTKPHYFMPVHGEHRMLKTHKDHAIDSDIDEDKIFVCENGDTLKLLNGKVSRGHKVKAGDVYVDGSRVGEVGSIVINDRKLMGTDGILVTLINIDRKNKKLLLKPNITTRGFIHVNENKELIRQIENKVTSLVNNNLNDNYSLINLKNQIILELNPYITKLTGRSPIILPVIMKIKKDA